MRRFRRGVGLQQPFVLYNLEGKGIEHVVGRLSGQVLGYGPVDDLFAASTKNIDLDEGVSRFEPGCQSPRVLDTHGAPKYNFAFLLPAADQLVFRLRPSTESSPENNYQSESAIPSRFEHRSVPHMTLVTVLV